MTDLSQYGSVASVSDEDCEALQTGVKSEFQKETKTSFAVTLLLGSLFIIASIGLTSYNAYYNPSSWQKAMSLSSSSESPAKWTLSREGYDSLSYFTSDASSVFKYKMLNAGFNAVIEPNVNMNIYIEGYDARSKFYYEFSVCKAGSSEGCTNGKVSITDNELVYEPVNVPCTPRDVYTVTLNKYNSNGELKATSNTKALCTYVRREIRSLSTDDLDKTMDAMFTLWTTEESVGQKKYGKNFHNSTWFVQAHHFNAAWRDGDHIHEGLGFLTQHIKISNMFEFAIQAVDPSISLPYWDYTIDSENNPYIFTAFPFNSKVFGSINKPKDENWGWTYRNDSMADAAIKNGRWKNIRTDMNFAYEDLKSNFGYLRAPWNANPSPYVSRFSGYTTQLPDCNDHYHLLEYNTLADFLTNSPYSPHASVHGAIGSVYGCDVMDPLRQKGLLVSEDEQNSLCQKWGFVMKELYRKNFISPQSECSYTSLDYSGVKCSVSCNEDKYDSLPTQLSSIISSKYVGTLSDSQWKEWRDFVCEGDSHRLFVGDHVESASPADPSFWPVHPTLERLYQAKMMAGGFTDSTWATDARNDYVCDKANCYEDDVQGWYDECCYGHFENDQLLDFVNADKAAGYGPTNKEVILDLDPSTGTYAATYIYDGFSWDHCSEDFEQLLTHLKNNEYGYQLFSDGKQKANPISTKS